MVRCHVCQFANPDDAARCERCNADLADPLGLGTPGVVPPGSPLEGPFPEGMPFIGPVQAIRTAGPPASASPFDFFGDATPEPAPPRTAPEPPAAPAPPVLVPASKKPPSAGRKSRPGGSRARATEPPESPPPDRPDAPAAPRPDVPRPREAALAPAQPAAASDSRLPLGAEPKLVVVRGRKRNVEFPIYEGQNFIGRMDEKPVDIDLEDQEPPDRIWSSRQHAVLTFENGRLVVEDLKSANGTFVNRHRVQPGQKRRVKPGDIIQIGTIHLRVSI